MNEENKTIEDTLDKIGKSISRLDHVRSTLERSVSSAKDCVEEADNKLESFYHNADDFAQHLQNFPEMVDSRLKQNLEKHMKFLSDHIIKETNTTTSKYSDDLHHISVKCLNSLDKVKNRMGWRGYIVPICASFVSFFAACGVAWWMKQGMIHFNEGFVNVYQNGLYFNASLSGLSEEQHKKVREILQSGHKKWEDSFGIR